MIGLTPRQRDLLAYLHGCELCPSYEEMREAIGLENKSGITRLVDALEERGYIRRLPNRARAIELIPQTPIIIKGQPYRFIQKTRAA